MEKINYTVLIHKQLTGKLTEGETTQLSDWLATDTNHVIEAENIRKVWIWSQSKVSGFEPDVEGALAKLKIRIQEDQSQSQPARSSLIISIVKYAAAAIFLFSLGFFAHQQYHNEVAAPWQMVETTANEVQQLTLSDGSQISLNENSYLTYPEQLGASERIVKLDGEAFFSITRDESRPFTVQLDHGDVKVLGTSFNIWVNPEKQTTTISVATGRVAFVPKGSSQEFILTANEKLIYNQATQSYKKIKIDTRNDWSWKSHNLIFQDTQLEAVIPAIEKHFGIQLQLANPKLKKCRSLTASFKEVSQTDIFAALSLSVGIDIKKKSETLYIGYGGVCE